jgi:hypothetical protein
MHRPTSRRTPTRRTTAAPTRPDRASDASTRQTTPLPHGCAGEIATCVANAACSVVYACAVKNHCFEQARFQDIVSCGLPCIEAAMISSQSDPAIADIYAIAVCAQTSCNGPCHVGDAAIPGQ